MRQDGQDGTNRAQPDAQKSAQQPVVYLVQIGKHVKIGFTSNFARRLKAFLTSSVDVKPLLVVPGDRALENHLHKLCSDLKLAREIFHFDGRLQAFIGHVERDGLERGLKYLTATTALRRKEMKRLAQLSRITEDRKTRAELNAHYASLVADRKCRLGW